VCSYTCFGYICVDLILRDVPAVACEMNLFAYNCRVISVKKVINKAKKIVSRFSSFYFWGSFLVTSVLASQETHMGSGVPRRALVGISGPPLGPRRRQRGGSEVSRTRPRLATCCLHRCIPPVTDSSPLSSPGSVTWGTS